MPASQVRAETNKEQFRWGYRKKGKEVFNTCRRLAFCITLAGFVGFAGFEAAANPSDGTVVSGSATISGTGTSTVTINQTTNKAIIEWGNFDINAGETTQFIQPDTSSLALNRVVNSNQATAINGNLIANGKVLVINPNGVLIGATGNVDVAGFVASTADIGNTAFMTGTGAMEFNKAGKADATVENNGRITIRDTGLGLLVAPVVRNNGLIEGNLAKIQLGAGDTFGVDMYGDGLLHLAVSDSAGSRTIKSENTGTIVANAGKVVMTAAAASSVVNSVINTTGVIEAKGLVNKGGEIILTGAGASIKVAGKLDVSGKTGGGSIKIGGDYQGGGTLAKADKVEIAETAVIDASATDNGDGGTIIVWSEQLTAALGRFYAMGGENGGNGGLVETSSVGDLYVDGSYVNTLAAAGQAGWWLLDPTNINVNATGTAYNPLVHSIGLPTGNANVSVTSINSASSNVALNATNNINFNTDVNIANSGVGLYAYAGNTISLLNNSITTNGGHVKLDAGTFVNINNSAITTNGGNITLIASRLLGSSEVKIQNSSFMSGGGYIDIYAKSDLVVSGNSKFGTNGGDFTANTGLLGTLQFTNTTVNTTGGSTAGSISASDILDWNITQNEFGNNNNWYSGTNGGKITISSGNVKQSNNNCFKAGGTGTCAGVPDPGPTTIAITITAPDQFITYGSTLFDTLLYSVSAGALMGSADLSGHLTRVDAANWNVNSYQIEKGTVGVINAGSYTYLITWDLGKLVINPAILTVTANAMSKTYDGLAFNSGSGDYTIDASGFKFSDDASAITGGSVVFGGDAQGAVNAGTYDIDIQGSNLAAQNYTFKYVDNTLTVNKALLTLTANNQSKTFGQTFVFNGSEYAITSGTLYGADSINTNPANLSSLGSPALAPAGSYGITFGALGGVGLGNYDITTVNGTMTVNPAPNTTVFTAGLGRPIVSVANQAIVLDRQFEPIETKTLDTNVAIGMQQPTAQFLANLEPAAGGEMTAEELANLEPAAGPGVGGASGNADISCANDFLNNQPCAIDQ
ncbi:MAG: filamentous hemagglutinin N-terminal domain-containing protein [Alphaproteobacteria bacterium]|nr:filamentous hemagglutinin N-terminal domain-containing protein [Alphaproteobacteria bacterium]